MFESIGMPELLVILVLLDPNNRTAKTRITSNSGIPILSNICQLPFSILQ